jgi:hypothetical protein
MRTKVIDMRLETDNDNAVYDQLGEMFVDISHPRAYFDTHFDFVGPGDEITKQSAQNVIFLAVSRLSNAHRPSTPINAAVSTRSWRKGGNRLQCLP